MKLRRASALIEHLPDSPGVYLFYGAAGELLYVGKSKVIRTRVRSHFSSPDEAGLCRQVYCIEPRQTAGELGALLLESQLIKELQPLYNVRSRYERRIVVGRRVTTKHGYFSVALEAISSIDPAHISPIMALFKTRTQAKMYLAEIVKTHRLCPKLLGLEKTTRLCFSYHLHQCNGACMGFEHPLLYNARFEEAFAERRIKAWPFEGGVVIEERGQDGNEGEVFMVDNWCLLYSFTYSQEKYKLRVRGLHRFDYDSYKILAGYVFDEANQHTIRQVSRQEFETLIRKLKAA
ncbi:MAG: GIY-YIG nuclease family protein [Ignavibacteria bacterium]|nr:GIY-YIG nuclease family protein [Ignavibacteria bacterium]